MPKEHRLIMTQNDTEGAGGVCSCGRSGFAGKDKAAVKRMFKQHLREVGATGR